MKNTVKKGKPAASRKTTTGDAAKAKRKPNAQEHLADKKTAPPSKAAPGNPKLTNSTGTPKASEVVRLLQRKNGASIAEIQKASGWQPHSVRGFLSGTVKKRMGHDLRSDKSISGVRRYIIGTS